MKIIFILPFILIVTNSPLHAQFNTYDIGKIQIGFDSLYSTKIGKASTPACPRPGACNSNCSIYIFKGSGNWSIEGNWEGNFIPPSTLSGCNQIIINPVGTNECLMNIPFQVIPAGTSISVLPGKKFRIPGKLAIK